MLLCVVSLGFAVFTASGKTTGTRKRSIFGEPQLDKAGDSRRQLMDQDLAIGDDIAAAARAQPVAFKVERYAGLTEMQYVLVHYRVQGALEAELLTDNEGDIQIKDRSEYNGLVAVDKNGRLWKNPSVNSALVMASEKPCERQSVPVHSQSMVMSPNGDFVTFFSEHSLFAQVRYIEFETFSSVHSLIELEAYPLPAVSFRGDEAADNCVWVALTNSKVARLSGDGAQVKYWNVPGADEIAAFRVSADVSRIAFVRALRERSIYICKRADDKCTELRTNGPVVADFQWHGDDQILCRTMTGSMFVWNVVELLYKKLEGADFEDVSAFTCSGGQVYIAHSDGSFKVTPVPGIDWTQGGDASVERSTTRRVAYFARHPQAEQNVKSFCGYFAKLFPNAQVTATGLQQLNELRNGMRDLSSNEADFPQAYEELHDAANVYVAMSPLVRAVWAAMYALDGICDRQIAENYTVHIHGTLQENLQSLPCTCGPMQNKYGVKAAAISGFGDIEDGQRMLDSVEINEDYNSAEATYTYDAKQLLTEVRDSQAADGKVLFFGGHSHWFKHFINDDKVQLDATCQQFRDELNTNQKGKLHNCQVARFEYEVAADGSIQMWDCRSVFTPDTQTR